MNYSIAYNEILINNLIAITQLNTQLCFDIERLDIHDPHFIEIENSIKSQILFHFAHLLGIHVKFSSAKKFALGMNKLPEDTKEQALLNIRNIIDYINASYNGEHFSIMLLHHLNKLFLNEIKDIWDIGKMPSFPTDIDEVFSTHLPKEIIFQSQMNEYINKIDMFLHTSQSPTIVKNTIVTFDLLSHTFYACGSDAVSLGVLFLLSKKAGYNRFSNYYKCIYNVLEHSRHETLSLQLFIEQFLHELQLDLKDVKSKLSPLVDDMHITQNQYVDLNLRQIKGVTYIKEKGKISREIYAKLNNISHITAYRDLNNLLQKGYVHVEGIGKGTKYLL